MVFLSNIFPANNFLGTKKRYGINVNVFASLKDEMEENVNGFVGNLLHHYSDLKSWLKI
jgi:hypothetical protein